MFSCTPIAFHKLHGSTGYPCALARSPTPRVIRNVVSRLLCVQTNMYIVWSLVSAGERGLDREINALHALGRTDPAFSKDPYFLGLLSATLFEVRRCLFGGGCAGTKGGGGSLWGQLRAQQQSTHVDIVCRAQATEHCIGHCLPFTSNRALKWTLFAVHKQQSTQVDIVCRAQATEHSSGHCLPFTLR